MLLVDCGKLADRFKGYLGRQGLCIGRTDISHGEYEGFIIELWALLYIQIADVGIFDRRHHRWWWR